MMGEAMRRALVALRDRRRERAVARLLWIAWAVIVWNVVFDHIIVVAGREYLAAAVAAASNAGPYARMDDWMRPAVTRGLQTATAAAAALLAVGLVAIQYAARTAGPRLDGGTQYSSSRPRAAD